MKKLFLITAFSLLFCAESFSQVEFKVITSVESIVPSGLGRSRIVSANEIKNYKDYTSTQTEDDNSRNKSDRTPQKTTRPKKENEKNSVTHCNLKY